jgi:ABC-type cobalamin/Fe3+-siderophores transport system ATPase subunit
MPFLQVTLQNYRAFPRNAPITFDVDEGITFLLGVNNVGKSALLRAFFELRSMVAIGLLSDAAKVGQSRDGLGTNTPFDLLTHRATQKSPILIRLRRGEGGFDIQIEHQGGDTHTQAVDVSVKRIGSGAAAQETLSAITALFARSMYVGSFRSPATQVTDRLFDVQIGTGFVADWDSWANGTRSDQRQQVRLLVRELKGLFGFTEFDISVSQDTRQLLVATDDGEFSLSELGDGIAHYIITLGNALIRQPAFIFIDEPEIGLHPRMQEIFVRTLASKAKMGLIATSHSVGLARSVADRMIMVTRDDDGRRRLAPFGQHREETLVQSILELGFSQYAEIGANHLLLVEGRTDIKAFREILRKFGLDQHFLIWSLNGSDWIKADPTKVADELNELKRLNTRSVSVIFDSERASAGAKLAPDINRFAKLCAKLGFLTFPTDRHSTENYVTQAALDIVFPHGRHIALGPYDAFSASPTKWDKASNWLLFREMLPSDFDGTALGDFIANTMGGAVQKAKGS